MELEQLLQDESFRLSLAEAETPEAAAALLQDRGIDVTAAQLQLLAAQAPQGELDETALEQVAGGMAPGFMRWLLPILPLIPKLLPKPAPIMPRRFLK